MFKIKKRGLIYCPDNLSSWQDNTFITPTPIEFKSYIRIYGGFRDKLGVSRIGYIDVAKDNPSNVLKISESPVLDIGRSGMFDDNGIILGSILKYNDDIFMYYVGFQLVKKVKFLAFSGLAISKDGGESFIRYSETPILDRAPNECYIRAIHTVIKEKDHYDIWYSTGWKWQIINGVDYPQYVIKYGKSFDGKNIITENPIIIDVEHDEYRIGRPTVFKHNNKYHMFYTRDTLSKKYSPGYAQSSNGRNWERKDELFSLLPSEGEWDSEMTCYPVPLFLKDSTYIFYSGNGMGKSGVGYAELLIN